jgi:cytochrome c
MPSHPGISANDASTIVKYILSINEKQSVQSRPVSGSYVLDTSTKVSNNGNLIFRAAYRDKGTKLAPAQSSEDVVVFRNPIVGVANADKAENVEFTPGRTRAMPKGSGSYLAISKVDLTGIKQIEFAASVFGGTGPGLGGIIEIHDGSSTGQLLGSTPEIAPPAPGTPRRRGPNARIKAPLTNVSGMHDLYFVFVNDKAKKTDVLLSLNDIKFSDQLQ